MADQQPQSEQQKKLLADAEQLTAYLDGELSSAEVAEVEQRLFDDENFRKQMRQLHTSWDLLDALPQTRAHDAFVRTTMELVAQVADDENKSGSFKSGVGLMLFFVALPIVAWVSYVLTTQQNRIPTIQLLRNLPLIENFDRYEKADLNINFLDKLAQADLFTSDVVSLFPPIESGLKTEVNDDVSLHPSEEKLAQRRARLKSMLPRQLESIKRNKSEFDALSSGRRRAVQEFHQAFVEHPRHQQINSTLVAYYDWLKPLGPSERTALLDTPAGDQRIDLIAAKIERQNLESFGKAGGTKLPTEEDAEALFRWYDQLVKENTGEIRAAVVPAFISNHRKKFAQAPETSEVQEFQRLPLSQLMAFIFKNDRAAISELISDQQISRLKLALSSEANDILDRRYSNAADRTNLIINWINAANLSRFSIAPEKLKSFYAGLSDHQRDELADLAPPDWRNTLIRLYRKDQLSSSSGFDENEAIFSER